MKENHEYPKNVFLSDVKIRTLLSLNEGPKNSKEIKEDLNSSSAVHMNLKEFVNSKIIVKENNKFKLSSKGELLVMNIINIIENFYVMKHNKVFWESHDFSDIPSIFINKLSSFKDAEYVFSSEKEIIDPLQQYLDTLFRSQEVHLILPIFSMKHLNLIKLHLENDKKIDLILTADVLDSFMEYSNFNQLKNYSRIGKLNIWELNKNIKININFSDSMIILALFLHNGYFDFDNILVDDSESGLDWCHLLFEHYKELSNEILF